MTDRYCLQYGRLQQAFDDKDAAGRQPSAAFHLTADGALHQVPGIPPLKVGEGVNPSRESMFTDVDWSDGVYFFETEVDRGTGYESQGTQQLLSVPYAKCAVTADNVHVKSPDGKLWKIKVSNDGTVSAEAVTE